MHKEIRYLCKYPPNLHKICKYIQYQEICLNTYLPVIKFAVFYFVQTLCTLAIDLSWGLTSKHNLPPEYVCDDFVTMQHNTYFR